MRKQNIKFVTPQVDPHSFISLPKEHGFIHKKDETFWQKCQTERRSIQWKMWNSLRDYEKGLSPFQVLSDSRIQK